jgi:hypothetical protein
LIRLQTTNVDHILITIISVLSILITNVAIKISKTVMK